MAVTAVRAGRAGPATYPQAIPLGVYRRKLFVATQLPKLGVLLAAVVLYSASASPWFALRGARMWAPSDVERTAVSSPSITAEAPAVELTAPVETADDPLASMRYLAQGQAPTGPLVGAARTNALISIAFIDGYVIQP